MILVILLGCFHGARDRSFMEECTTDDDCAGGLQCMEIPVGDTAYPLLYLPSMACTVACESDTDCPDDQQKGCNDPWPQGSCIEGICLGTTSCV